MGLTARAGLQLAPLLITTPVRHYFERFIEQKTPSSDGPARDGEQDRSTPNDSLKQEEFLYDQVFTIVKDFMSVASQHTVEELQQFSNLGTPSSSWVRTLRVVVPTSCCDQAAKCLIDALGGETATKRIVGGTKWWQIRGSNGLAGEWAAAEKDWKEVKRRAKSRERRGKSKETRERESSARESNTDSTSSTGTSESDYTPDMDEQKCILYFHGGGYYFGSVNQQRGSIQRIARKTNGRVFAIDYRLSPQYPFPCAIQDALAAYLYLIQPPAGAKHTPVKPENIVIMGNSAGGGLALAVLQVIRDSGLQRCAGGVLVSPWCDLSHSFPSIIKNTETDLIPLCGLSMHKPSTLWPPPGNAESKEVRQGIRDCLRSVAGLSDQDQVVDAGRQVDFDASALTASAVDGQDQRIVLEVEAGKPLVVDSQIQFYAPNNLLPHPLVSPCRAYLGGLPPLLFTAGDQEVLRDEIIYTAHRAANPSEFPTPAESERLYPKIREVEAKHATPTNVHLQVYDGCAHDLPNFFPFTTPAKYCFRAIASFCRFATGMQPLSHGSPCLNGPGSPLSTSFFRGSFFATPPEEIRPKPRNIQKDVINAGAVSEVVVEKKFLRALDSNRPSEGNGKPLEKKKRWSMMLAKRPPVKQILVLSEELTEDAAGPRFGTVKEPGEGRYAGDYPPIYEEGFAETNFIRERVSIRGLIRPLEPEHELPALKLEENLIGVFSEVTLRRYIEGKAKSDGKFCGILGDIRKERTRNLKLARKESDKSMSHLESYLARKNGGKSYLPEVTEGSESRLNLLSGLHAQKITTDSWNWSWALGEGENPPPSSIVSRRDTLEARQLAMIAEPVLEKTIRGNNLGQYLTALLAVKQAFSKKTSSADQRYYV